MTCIQLLKKNAIEAFFITNQIPDVLCLMFADDVANCSDTVINLQTQLNIIDDLCKGTGMRVYLEKIEIIVFFEMLDLGVIQKSGNFVE